MKTPPDMEAIFPIKDAASAALMVIKADCLRKADLITDLEERWVCSRARTFLDDESVIPPDRRGSDSAPLVSQKKPFPLESPL